MKRKRAYSALYSGANPDGNYTPSDSDSDSDDEDLRPVQRKIIKNQSNRNSDDERSNNVDDGNRASNSRDVHGPGNSQLLYAALRKIQELENELADLDDADYDSGHQEEEDEIDEGNASDLEDNIPLPLAQNHNHLNDIANANAEALGFAYCVKETFDYLASEGVTEDNPIVQALRERFLDRCDPLPLN